MNYPKFALKSREELETLLSGRDNLFIVTCNKCFKELSVAGEPESAELTALAGELGKTVTGTAAVDFLCNSVQTERTLQGLIPEGTENVLIASCGLGVQTLADRTDLPVFAASDTLNYIGQHGMALTQKTCGACAQCYLNVTGGICPIVDCSKSLVNGQCGGAKNGKCELDPQKDCAWENIYRRLEKQGRLEEFLHRPVQLRDYSKVSHKLVADYVKAIRENRLDGYYGGVHPLERKGFTESISLREFPEPEVVVIPTSMHSGKPATPVVQVGDHVNVGQLIAEAAGFISANVHSSVSGTVEAIEPRVHPIKGPGVLSIVIRSDGKDTIDSSVQPAKPIEELTPDEIIDVVRDKAITGMGGAGFPTYVKLKPGKPIDAVLINGCECEPLITSDHRVMLEYPEDVVYGLRAMVKAVNAPRGVIVIEDNKPDAAEAIRAAAAPYENIEVLVVRTKYPQGAEKMLIKRVLGRSVPSGGLPADAGAVVSNASSSKAIADALRTGMPLVKRVVSVTGEKLCRPGNYIVRIGTNVQDIIDYCGGTADGDVTVKMGGFMMGTPLQTTEVPVIKGTNGIIAIETDHTTPVDCIRCGRCVDVCPMELKPLYFAKYADEGNVQGLNDEHIRDCMECRCCEYICSAKIPLVTKIRAGKLAVMEAKK